MGPLGPSWGPGGPKGAQKGSDLAVIQGVPEPVPAHMGPYGPGGPRRAQEGPAGRGQKRVQKAYPFFGHFWGHFLSPKVPYLAPIWSKNGVQKGSKMDPKSVLFLEKGGQKWVHFWRARGPDLVLLVVNMGSKMGQKVTPFWSKKGVPKRSKMTPFFQKVT